MIGRRLILVVPLLVYLLGPLLLFRVHAGPLGSYYRAEEAPGQAAYVMMRPAGLLAFQLAFLQILLGLHHSRIAVWLGVRSLLPLHRALGGTVLTFAVLHPVLFAFAQTLRTGHGAFGKTFLPSPTANALSPYFVCGAVALYVMILAALAAALGARRFPRAWRAIHRLNLAAFVLLWFHAITLGAEVRGEWLAVFYTLLLVVALGMAGARALRKEGSSLQNTF